MFITRLIECSFVGSYFGMIQIIAEEGHDNRQVHKLLAHQPKIAFTLVFKPCSLKFLQLKFC